jgi:hypothetical protein
MIQRVVCVKLKPPYRTDEARAQVAAETGRVLPRAAGVASLTVNVPADDRARSEWDLCILVRFASLAEVEAYRTDPVHRSYVDVFLKPMMERIRVWNFEIVSEA